MAKAAKCSKSSRRKPKRVKAPVEPPSVKELRSKAPAELVEKLRQFERGSPVELVEKLRQFERGSPVELVEKLRQFERETEARRNEMPKISAADYRMVNEYLSPSQLAPRQQKDGPQVRRAKELMAAAYPGGEWRSMMIKAVHRECGKEANARGWKLPSPDSFSRAMGRRARR
jgi:hypothetical protein